MVPTQRDGKGESGDGGPGPYLFAVEGRAQWVMMVAVTSRAEVRPAMVRSTAAGLSPLGGIYLRRRSGMEEGGRGQRRGEGVGESQFGRLEKRLAFCR
jgi:hypothetical protein